MFSLRNWTIKAKLTATTMLTSIMAVLLACASFIVFDYFTHRQTLVDDLSGFADMLGGNCKAALQFDRPKDAETMLSSLAAREAVTFACIFDGQREVFAAYRRLGSDPNIAPPDRVQQGHVFERDHVGLFHQVIFDQKVIGTVYIQAEMRQIYGQLANDAGILAIAALIALVVSLLLSTRLQAMISRPILALATVARGVSGKNDYSLRAVKEGDDEVGLLIDAFNDMLAEVQHRDTALRISEKRFRAMFEQAAVGVAQIESDTGRFLRVNKKYSDIVGLTPEEMTATTFMDITHPDDVQPDLENMERLKRSEITEYSMEKRYVRKDGSTVWVNLSVSPMWAPGEKPTWHIAVVEDITERRRAEVELRESLAVAKSAQSSDRAKSEFLANMSHEIRTPMTAILGFGENLLDEDLSESERLNSVHTIRRNGEYLLGLINDILDLSKIESGEMLVERMDCNPCQIVAEVVSLMRVRAISKRLSFTSELVGAIPEIIQSDPMRLRQILINLVGNAIKFTDTGTVRLITRLIDNGGVTSLQFEVIDSGCGMTPQQTARLFQPFAQADSSTTRKFGGTGLGLTISKRFAEMLGGDIVVVSTELGVGSTFRATVVAEAVDGTAMLEGSVAFAGKVGSVVRIGPSDLFGLRILLAEDGPDNQRLFTYLLEKAGAEVTVVDNGKLALDAALTARDEGTPFGVILMDMQMPVMDGYKSAGALRKKGYTGSIIALTANAMEGDAQKCIAAGCDAYATKPIDRKKLIETIQSHRSPADARPQRQV